MSSEAISADDLVALRDSVADLVARGGGSEAVRASMSSTTRTDAPLWSGLVEVGAAALAIPEEDGGVGAGWGALAAVVEELGASLSPVQMIRQAPFESVTRKHRYSTCDRPFDLTNRWLPHTRVLPLWYDSTLL